MKKYTAKYRQAASPEGMIYGWQLAKAHGRTPACYHVGLYGRGYIRTYDSGTKEAIYDSGRGSFAILDMVATKLEADAWVNRKTLATEAAQ
jgi:hypothetical protein